MKMQLDNCVYNHRIEELSILFSKITGLDKKESQKIILSTDTGKAIQDNNELVLYEQSTDNLYQIGKELNDNRFTVEKIVEVYNI